jgi:hypothetical protein
MTEIRSIQLDEIPTKDGIKFIKAQWWDDNSPLVVIHLSYRGDVERLRMDIDKRTFLDHLTDPQKDKTVQKLTMPIWEIVAKERLAV